MQLIQGNLWNEIGKADLILFTANSTFDKNGALVMGAGAAKEAVELFPRFSQALGNSLGGSTANCAFYGLTFGMATHKDGTRHLIGAFQTKFHWREPSTLELIADSTKMLNETIERYRWERIALNFPGIGLGGLDRADVLPIIETLPDNVFVYER